MDLEGIYFPSSPYFFMKNEEQENKDSSEWNFNIKINLTEEELLKKNYLDYNKKPLLEYNKK